MIKSRRLWSVAFLLAGALALAACLPPGPDDHPLASQDCIGSTPTSASAYQQLFDLRSTTWDAGDSTTFVPRGGSPGVWLFGDTYSGRVMHDGSLGPGWKMVNSSAMTESGNCLTPHFGGAFLDPHELFPNPGDGTWYWPGGAVANSDGSMQVMLTRIRSANTGQADLSFAPVGVAVARVGADLSVQSITTIPGDRLQGGYTLRTYGDSVATDSQYAYLYAFAPVNFFGLPVALDQFVARAPLGNLAGAWQYSACTDAGCTSRTWSGDPLAASPMKLTVPPGSLETQNNLPLAAFQVTRYGNGYLAVAKGSNVPTGEARLNAVYAWFSTTPDGPWEPRGSIVGATVAGGSGEWSYGARLVATPSAGLLATWNVNAPTDQVYAWVRHYGPRFAQPRLP